MADSLAIWTAILTRRFSDGHLFGEQGVDGLDGADFAALNTAQGDIDERRRTHRTPPKAARRRPTAS
jgi:hypothetical protein